MDVYMDLKKLYMYICRTCNTIIDVISSNNIIQFMNSSANSVAPIATAISAFFISNFFFRFATSYKRHYITARQTVTPLSVLTSLCPTIILAFGCFRSQQRSIFGFALISSILSVFYPLLLGKRIIAVSTLFPVALLFSALITDYSQAIYLFMPSIIAALYIFDGESEMTEFVYRKVLAPFLIYFYVGLSFAPFIPRDPQIITFFGFVGSFVGLFF